MEKQKKGQAGVYRLYKLAKGAGNSFTTDFKTLERDLHVVNHSYAENVNFYSKMNGSLYEYDEKASDLYWAKKPYKSVKEYTDFEEVKKDSEVEQSDDLDSLKSKYEELSGKKAHHLWKAERISEEIEKINQKTQE